MPREEDILIRLFRAVSKAELDDIIDSGGLRQKKVSAKVYLLRTDEGGRQSPIYTGYRPTVYLGKKQVDGIVSFCDGEEPLLGEEYIVTLGLIHPEYLGAALKKNAVFDWREGAKIIARGIVLDVKA